MGTLPCLWRRADSLVMSLRPLTDTPQIWPARASTTTMKRVQVIACELSLGCSTKPQPISRSFSEWAGRWFTASARSLPYQRPAGLLVVELEALRALHAQLPKQRPRQGRRPRSSTRPPALVSLRGRPSRIRLRQASACEMPALSKTLWMVRLNRQSLIS